MAELESGLLLPIRFYNNKEEQDRYKNQSQGVALTELNYPYVDCAKLAPFQIILPQVELAVEFVLKAICANTGTTITLPFNAVHWQETVLNSIHWVSYLGTDTFTSLSGNNLYYLELFLAFEDEGHLYYYSDLFMTLPCDSSPDMAKSMGGGSIDIANLRMKG